jgi:outer membrane protein insertion porin family/translocation and assembly module TamA
MPCRRALVALGFFVAAHCVVSPAALLAQDIGCDRGDREVVKVEFSGNHAFPDAVLANGLVTTPSSWARRLFRIIGTRHCLDTLEVQRDPIRLLVLYRESGFTGTKVTSRIDTVRAGKVAVKFAIQEGAPIILEQFTITGLDSVPRSDRITAGLPIKIGGRLDNYAVEASRDTILRRLRDNGYPSSDLLRSYESDTAKRVATLKFDVATGPRAHIGAVKIAVTARDQGRQRISDSKVRSTLGFEPGDLYRERDLEGAKRALYLSDAYRHVEVSPDTASLAPSGDSTIDVNVSLAESYTRSLRPSVGWATLDCFRTQVDYSDFGLLGALRRLDISARASKIGVGDPTKVQGPMGQICSPSVRKDLYSDTLNYYLGATLRQSSLFGLRVVPSVTLYSEVRSEYSVFRRFTPIGAIVSLNQQLRRTLGATYAYQLEYGRTSAEPAIFCGVIGVCDVNEQDFLKRSQRLATASVTLGRDRRNDPFYPTAGSSMSLELRNASQFIGSDADLQFNKIVGDASWYWALARNSVLAARIRAGFVFGQRISLGASEAVFIPQQERLYAGGANTVRGFRQNELGPVVYLPDTLVCISPVGACVTPTTARDTVYFSADQDDTPRTLPVGGNSVVVANVEVRMPSPFIPDRLQVAFFADAGQVWTRGGTGVEQSFGSLKVTPGVGVRLASPIGPIRLDIGYNPYDRPAGSAYLDAPVRRGEAPLYCVSPRNGLPVTGWSPKPGRDDPPAAQANPSGTCPSTYVPNQGGFFRRLSFNASIGQAF